MSYTAMQEQLDVAREINAALIRKLSELTALAYDEHVCSADHCSYLESSIIDITEGR